MKMFYTVTIHIAGIVMFKGRTTSGIAELPNFEHFGTSLPNCLRTVRRPLLYYKEGEILVIFSASGCVQVYSCEGSFIGSSKCQAIK